jgi:hypothetical protein
MRRRVSSAAARKVPSVSFKVAPSVMGTASKTDIKISLYLLSTLGKDKA